MYIDDVSITNSTDIHEIQSNNSIELEQNYPNPFNSVTNFKYAVATDEFVTLKVYDITGNEICTLVNEKKTAGTYEIAWNASAFRSGIYFSKLSVGNTVISKKLILLRQ